MVLTVGFQGGVDVLEHGGFQRLHTCRSATESVLSTAPTPASSAQCTIPNTIGHSCVSFIRPATVKDLPRIAEFGNAGDFKQLFDRR
jgi:hypothetical protein